jgi:hypothetical protein
MNNSNYAAKEILTLLLKKGWVSTECFSSEHVERDIKNIIDNAAVCNINLDPKGFTFDSAISQTYTFSA